MAGRPKRATTRPLKAVIRMFQVGFGDCFLLTFQYQAFERHVLIDFGSTGYPGGEEDLLEKIAASIAERTGGKLHIVVATHRHQDHIKGFGLKGPGGIIKGLTPDLVIQPWTEDPDIPVDAKGPEASARRHALASMNLAAVRLCGETEIANFRHLEGASPQKFAEFRFIGEDNLSNKKAVEALLAMGAAGAAKYVHAGQRLRVGRILPGVEIDVLGPPTVEQHKAVAGMRREDDGEFWRLQAAAAGDSPDTIDPFTEFEDEEATFDTRWLAERLKALRLDALLQIVRALDHAMNNTSLILLFRVGGRSLLFPGDAQIENWEYALKDESVLRKLADVDVYKVGHHGSTNATPKTLWAQFSKKKPRGGKGRLMSILSTLEGKHHKVPRSSLVEELSRRSTLISTERFGEGILYRDIEIRL